MKRDDDLMGSIQNYLSQYPKRKYSHNQIARIFGSTALETSSLLKWMAAAGMLSKEEIHGKPVYLHKRDEEERDTRVFVTKEYKPGPGWNRVTEQLADFRAIQSKHV
jgi:hypothetical protein